MKISSLGYVSLRLCYRWLISEKLNIATVPAVVTGQTELVAPPITLPLTCLEPTCRSSTPAPETQTLPPKFIHHRAIAKLKTALNHVHTEEELNALESGIDGIM